MERWELENTHAYRIYQNTHRGQYKGTETEVEKQERLVRTREYYEKEFSERYKTILSEKIRKPEQIEHEKAVEPILKEMGTKLGKLFMCSFHLKQAMKSYHN